MGGMWSWGLRMIWRAIWEEGGRSPLGGLTRNLWGEEVWTLKATGEEEQRDLKTRLQRHLVLRMKFMRTSASEISTKFSIADEVYICYCQLLTKL